MGKLIKLILKKFILLIDAIIYSEIIYKKRKQISRLKRYNRYRKYIKKVDKACHIKLHVTGLNNLPNEMSYMITPNHQSVMDTLILIDLIDTPISYVAKSQLKNKPVISKIVPNLDGYFLERDDLKQELKVMLKVRDSLKKDNLKWVIFPEGTRSKDKDLTLGNFKPGTYKFPMSLGKKIVPCAIHGTHDILSKKSHKKQYDVYVHFFEPLTSFDYENQTTSDVAFKIQKMIEEKVNEFKSL